MEKNIKTISGFTGLFIGLVILALGLYFIISQATYHQNEMPTALFWIGIICFPVAIFVFKGIFIIQPNYAMVLTFFGKYVGTSTNNGLGFTNPFYSKLKVSLRAQSLESAKLKVNDKVGNPIEIGAVIVWQIKDTYKAVFDVVNFNDYIRNQSEAAIRHLTSIYAYDNWEDEHAQITLRDGGDKVIELLQEELNVRLAPAGVIIKEARISHLAYSPEIAGAMLQRQQATAIVAARSKIVEGAVGMVEMALDMLSRKEIVELDNEKKAAMVSNLMVVLCGERAASPVLNTGTLYQ